MDEQADNIIQTINEAELKERFALEDVKCCKDCHAESDELGRSMIRVKMPEGNFVECCCKVSDAYNKISHAKDSKQN